MSLERIFIGIDASGDKGFDITSEYDRYFTIAAVTTVNFEKSKKIAQCLEDKWPGKKGKDLHYCWEDVLQIINKTSLRYYVLLIDKKTILGIVNKSNYKKISFPEAIQESRYSAIHDTYAKHGWLVINSLIKDGFRGHTEIRIDKDMSGPGWELYKKKVKDHTRHLGTCDIRDSGDEYPLVRIADIIANFSRWQLKEQIFVNNEPEIISILRPNMSLMRLMVSLEFKMEMENRLSFNSF